MIVDPSLPSDSSPNSPAQEVFKPRRKIPFLPLLGVSITAIVAVGIVIGLMWQSNSFIAKNQDIRSDASRGEQPPEVIGESQPIADEAMMAAENLDAQTNAAMAAVTSGAFIPGRSYMSPVDQRIAVTGGSGQQGNCGIASALGLGWSYNWGGVSNADARDPSKLFIDNHWEIKCFENTRNAAIPTNALITVGKNDY